MLSSKKTAGFSGLSDSVYLSIASNHLLEALSNNDYFEWNLVEKLLGLSRLARESFTRELSATVKKNKQRIAELSVSDWLKRYLDKYNNIERNPNTFFEYCSRTPKIQKLGRQDQIRLMRLFRMYDYLLVEPIQDLEYPVENILRFPMRLDSSPAEISAQIQTVPDESHPAQRTISEKLPLRELLRKYPAIGEQAITSGQIKLSHFDRPVRPSIRNWIYDYTSQLGQEHHDSMQRMKYMFSSANGKNLTSLEREKLGIILKSFDENVPLPVDAGRNEIVFEITDTANTNQSPTFATQGSTLRNSPDFIGGRERSNLRGANDSSRPSSSKSSHESFIKPYPRQETKPQMPTHPIQKTVQDSTFPASSKRKIPDTRYQIPDTSMQFTNPYPKPGTHEAAETKTELAGEAPVKLKGFSKGVSGENKSSTFPLSGKPSNSSKSNFPPPKPYVPSRPKNVFYPHYGPEREVKPEPRIEGNIVDLRDNDQRSRNNEQQEYPKTKSRPAGSQGIRSDF
ncbi:MAG: hypothetical protein QMD77_02790 [Patescibacteria group bacterium]|nr:hypothetical protein [Patescibacteria group bacterium]